MDGILALPRPEAVLFDFDGVIVDSEPVHFEAFRSVLQPLGIGFTWREYVDAFMGFDDRDAFRELFRARGMALDDLRMARLVAEKSERFLAAVQAGVRAYPGAVPLIRSLRAAGVPLGMCSGALRADILPVLEGLGVAACFPVIVSADDVRKSKPDPESYRLAFRKAALMHPSRISSPDRCLAVEDTPAGIEAAKGAGMMVLAVTNSYPREALSLADFTIGSLEDVRIA
jgi:HAD superfamily hydrolase (TIGR01509 family)